MNFNKITIQSGIHEERPVLHVVLEGEDTSRFGQIFPSEHFNTPAGFGYAIERTILASNLPTAEFQAPPLEQVDDTTSHEDTSL